jgi:hypothetical protein
MLAEAVELIESQMKEKHENSSVRQKMTGKCF